LYCDVLRGWPSGSPDLNPIENLWAIIKRRVSELAPSRVEKLIGVVITVWNEISAAEMFNLVESMTTRLNATIAAQGGHIGYSGGRGISKNPDMKIGTKSDDRSRGLFVSSRSPFHLLLIVGGLSFLGQLYLPIDDQLDHADPIASKL
jgi:hypothetical protein